MMPQCCVINCKNAYRKTRWAEQKKKYHRIPTYDHKITEEWVRRSGNPNLKVKSSRFCSDHFDPETDYEKRSNCGGDSSFGRFKKNVLPTKKLPIFHDYKEKDDYDHPLAILFAIGLVRKPKSDEMKSDPDTASVSVDSNSNYDASNINDVFIDENDFGHCNFSENENQMNGQNSDHFMNSDDNSQEREINLKVELDTENGSDDNREVAKKGFKKSLVTLYEEIAAAERESEYYLKKYLESFVEAESVKLKFINLLQSEHTRKEKHDQLEVCKKLIDSPVVKRTTTSFTNNILNSVPNCNEQIRDLLNRINSNRSSNNILCFQSSLKSKNDHLSSLQVPKHAVSKFNCSKNGTQKSTTVKPNGQTSANLNSVANGGNNLHFLPMVTSLTNFNPNSFSKRKNSTDLSGGIQSSTTKSSSLLQNYLLGNKKMKYSSNDTGGSSTLEKLLTKSDFKKCASQKKGSQESNNFDISIKSILSSNANQAQEVTITRIASNGESRNSDSCNYDNGESGVSQTDEASTMKHDSDGNRRYCQRCHSSVAVFVCGGCSNQMYCSRKCQIEAWDDHSEECALTEN